MFLVFLSYCNPVKISVQTGQPVSLRFRTHLPLPLNKLHRAYAVGTNLLGSKTEMLCLQGAVHGWQNQWCYEHSTSKHPVKCNTSQQHQLWRYCLYRTQENKEIFGLWGMLDRNMAMLVMKEGKKNPSWSRKERSPYCILVLILGNKAVTMLFTFSVTTSINICDWCTVPEYSF